ncbi:MAG: aldehyde dehydrogenase family protein, partial [Methanoregulaceae archaeon]
MSKEKKITYVTLLSDESIHGEYESALERVEKELGHHHPIFINGDERWTGSEFVARSPVDNEMITGYFQDGTEVEVNESILASKGGFPGWSGHDWQTRAAIIRKTADRLDEKRFVLSALVTLECGKNRYEAIAEVSEGIDMLRYYCEIYEQNEGYIRPTRSEIGGEHCRSVMRPYGGWAV